MSRFLSLLIALNATVAFGQPITAQTVENFNKHRITLVALTESVSKQAETIKNITTKINTKTIFQSELNSHQELRLKFLSNPSDPTLPAETTIVGINAKIDELTKKLTAIADDEARARDAFAQQTLLCFAWRGETSELETQLKATTSTLRLAMNNVVQRASLWQDKSFQANKSELNKHLSSIKDTYEQLSKSGASCQALTTSIDSYFELVNGFTEGLNQATLARQSNRLEGIKTQLKSASDLTRAQSLVQDILNAHNESVTALSEASIAGIALTLAQAEEAQLIKSPEQSWERPADFLVWGGGLTSAVSLGAGFLQQREGASPKAWPWLGAGIGALSMVAGEFLKNQNLVPDAARKVADRAATNRLVGLEIQEMAARIAEAQQRFNSAEAPELTPVQSVSLEKLEAARSRFDTIVIAALTQVAPSSESGKTPAIADAALVQSEHAKWNIEAVAKLDELDAAFQVIQKNLPAVRNRANLLSNILSASGASVSALRNLLGNSIQAQCIPPRELTCKDALKTQTTTDAFCKLQPTGRPHFATAILSDEGKEVLLELGACSLELSRKATEKSNLAMAKLKTIEDKTDEWVKTIGPENIRGYLRTISSAVLEL